MRPRLSEELPNATMATPSDPGAKKVRPGVHSEHTLRWLVVEHMKSRSRTHRF